MRRHGFIVALYCPSVATLGYDTYLCTVWGAVLHREGHLLEFKLIECTSN